MRAKRVSESKTIMTQLVMPNDTNPLENLMGGNLMSWMDIAAGICAAKHSESYVVTASVDHVSFQRPIPLGDVVTLEATVTRAWKTSVEIYVQVYACDMKGGNHRRCNTAYFTFVAVDEETKRPCEVPAVLPLSSEEEQLYESAARRRELRLILGGRMKPEQAKDLISYFNPSQHK